MLVTPTAYSGVTGVPLISIAPRRLVNFNVGGPPELPNEPEDDKVITAVTAPAALTVR